MLNRSIFQIDQYCASYLDSESFWYRTQIVDKSPVKRSYLARIIDFGDTHEFPYENVTKLNDE